MSEKEVEFLDNMETKLDNKIRQITTRFWGIVGTISLALILVGFGWISERADIKSQQKAHDLRIQDLEDSSVSKYNFDYLASIYNLQTEEIIHRIDEIIGLISDNESEVTEAREKLKAITEEYNQLKNVILFKVEIGVSRGGKENSTN